MNLNNNLSTSLSTYLQNGDICNYLDLTRINKIDNLVNKLSLLDSLNNKTIFDFLFINIKHQLIVAECTYKFSLNLISVGLLIKQNKYYLNFSPLHLILEFGLQNYLLLLFQLFLQLFLCY